jgi:ribosome-binding factor A
MQSRRQERFARLIQKELGLYFVNEGKKIFGNLIISVTQVAVSPDLGYAKIYLSFLNEKDHDKALETVRNHAGEIKRFFGLKIRNEVRKIPEIHFFYDDTLDYMEKIDVLLKKLHDNEDQKK